MVTYKKNTRKFCSSFRKLELDKRVTSGEFKHGQFYHPLFGNKWERGRGKESQSSHKMDYHAKGMHQQSCSKSCARQTL